MSHVIKMALKKSKNTANPKDNDNEERKLFDYQQYFRLQWSNHLVVKTNLDKKLVNLQRSYLVSFTKYKSNNKNRFIFWTAILR